jgi:hypothetical protein
MASEDENQEEEFEDIPSEVEADASEVGNSSAQEKFDKLKKALKENSKKSKKEDKKKEKEEEKKKEDSKQEKKKKRKEEKKRRKRTPSPSPSPSSSSSASSSSSENGDGDDEYYGTRIPKQTIKSKPKHKAKDDYRSVSFNYDTLDTKSKDDVTIPLASYPNLMGLTLLSGNI